MTEGVVLYGLWCLAGATCAFALLGIGMRSAKYFRSEEDAR